MSLLFSMPACSSCISSAHYGFLHETSSMQEVMEGSNGPAISGAMVFDSFRMYSGVVMNALQQQDSSFFISDPRLPDHPIIYASQGFCTMSGFLHDEVVGHEFRFLEGPETNRVTILEIRDAIREEQPCQVRILNYTKHGKPMSNIFHLVPLYSREDGTLVQFVGLYSPVSRIAERDDSQRLAGIEMALWLFSGLLDDSAVLELDHKGVEAGGWGEPCRPSTLEVSAGTDSEVQEAEETRARNAVQSVVRELTRCSGGNVTDKRGVSLEDSAALGIVCSSLLLALNRVKQSFVLVDPHLPDMPIVHASEFFIALTGYSRAEVLGRNCRFLQGADTDALAIQEMRNAVKENRPCTVGLVNYRKDGQAFGNLLHLCPIRNCLGKIAFYAGVQLPLNESDWEASKRKGHTAHLKQLGAVGAIKVAVRSLHGFGLRRARNV
uniref:Putative LOV domain-containing protein n=1 Tax=Phaeoceros carolinianus TaxID=185665 RepID=A0A140F7I3_9EMBR|nr:putative LOV domain-containing protein [Phaeoceros carolinianus]